MSKKFVLETTCRSNDSVVLVKSDRIIWILIYWNYSPWISCSQIDTDNWSINIFPHFGHRTDGCHQHNECYVKLHFDLFSLFKQKIKQKDFRKHFRSNGDFQLSLNKRFFNRNWVISKTPVRKLNRYLTYFSCSFIEISGNSHVVRFLLSFDSI